VTGGGQDSALAGRCLQEETPEQTTLGEDKHLKQIQHIKQQQQKEDTKTRFA
jgi:hypothetical protein